MASKDLPTRLVICIDGTFCTADGTHGKGFGNTSNTYRICACVQKGKCVDPVTKRAIFQDKMYYEGIGSADNPGSISRLVSGWSGEGYKDMIKDVYQQCCKLGAEDEVWLYGFSRGAFIARAVAGLLHYIGALASAGTPSFDKEYSRALKVYNNSDERSRIGPGQIHTFLQLKTKQSPKIQFVGVFDTVKAVNDRRLHELSFNDSIKHFRQALALNEDREAMTPEYLYPDFRKGQLQHSDRSIIQAWFAGAHMDLGGSAKKDGLSLYPLQWMLLESESKGLVLGFSQFRQTLPWARIDNPLKVVFPAEERDGKGFDRWTCTTENQVIVEMQDLRLVHELPRYQGRYEISFNFHKNFLWPKQARVPFNPDGTLRGYVPFVPQGTIIHPSVYQLLDTGFFQSLSKTSMDLRMNLRDWTPKTLGSSKGLMKLGFWNDRTAAQIDPLTSIRILVVGNTGVGKSTLINRVFGVDVTQTSHREQGQHRIEDELVHPDRPDLILHDSGGFETGNIAQLQAVEDFVKGMSQRIRLEERLHVIWFCVEMNTSRVKQLAVEELFGAVSKYASDIPIVVVATKTDQFYGSQLQNARERLEDEGVEQSKLLERADTEAAAEVQKRLQLIGDELMEVEGGRFDASVAVRCSERRRKEDKMSIDRLSEVTMDCFSHERVRMMYVASQVANVDIKVDFAIIETMQIYRKVLGTASGLSAVPTAATSNRAAAAVSICQAVVRCFGVPTVGWRTVQEVVKGTIWDDLGHNVGIFLAEGFAVLGVLGSVATLGMPVFLASGAVNIPIVVPATTRLMLMLACDLILILTRAFRETTFTGVGQPLLHDVEAAARHYRPMCSRVHKDVMALIRRRDFIKAFKYNEITKGLEKIIYKYKEEVLEDVMDLQSPHVRMGLRPSIDSMRSVSLEDKKIEKEVEDELKEDERDLHCEYKELEGCSPTLEV